MARGDLFILSAPSGAGKTTLIQRLLAGNLLGPERIAFSVSYTTRRPRPGETHGLDYHFTDQETFERLVAAGELLEWAQVHGQYYGTARSEVQPRLDCGLDVLLDIDVQGARQVIAKMPEARTIFILPPSFEDLRSRLLGRGVDDPAEIDKRLSNALAEIPEFERYQYVIINDDADRAALELAAIILARRRQLERMRPQVEKIWRGPATKPAS
ncbi:MAG TPA: guanylate kinase [Thermoanaerobaculia bacterium]|nr:guanylate kinase [Thermoanaerobaculia bacterium]